MNLVGGEVGADILPKFLIPDIGLAGGQKIGALGADVEVDNVIPLPGTVHLRPGGDGGTAGRCGGAERYAVLVKQNVIRRSSRSTRMAGPIAEIMDSARLTVSPLANAMIPPPEPDLSLDLFLDLSLDFG